MNDINDTSIYLSRMEKNIDDKMFFLNFLKPDVTTVVDFGCANAALGLGLKQQGCKLNYVGYDNNHKMLIEARNNMPTSRFYGSLKALLEEVDTSKSILVLSSVIHEVYSYCKEEEIKDFWNFVFNSGFAQVSIRDMGLANKEIAMGPVPAAYAPIIQAYIYGKYDINKSFTYFAQYYQMWLKYWYKENWTREYNENYFAITVEEIKEMSLDTYYSIRYVERFTIPWVREKIQEDFGINPLKSSTHYKMILNLYK